MAVNDPPGPVELDPIARLRVLAAGLPGAVVSQRQIPVPFAAVWQVIENLEHATPRYEPEVAQVRITARHGEQLRLLVGYTDGRTEAMDAKLRPGWCLMQSATAVVAFAARPSGDGTLLAHLEHLRLPAGAADHWPQHHRRAAHAKLDQELRTIEQLASQPGPAH
jgi:hypothetical protein